jgi:hypothetical protein
VKPALNQHPLESCVSPELRNLPDGTLEAMRGRSPYAAVHPPGANGLLDLV